MASAPQSWPTTTASPVAAERVVEGVDVAGQRADLVETVGRDGGGRVRPEERGHRVVAGLAQGGQEVAPRVGGVGEPVEAEGQRAVRRTGFEVGELDAVGFDGGLAHGKTLLRFAGSDGRRRRPSSAVRGEGYGESVQVTFYGVRGSCPCSGDRYRRVGGNTSCVLVTIDGDDPLILDLGTGLRALGDAIGPELRAEGRPLRANALLTHLHFDHILGLPFFAPLHDPGAVLHVYGPRQDGGSLHDTLPGAVQPPFFPVQMTDFRGEVQFTDTGDEDFAVGSAKVRARSVPHRGNTLGFRIEADGRALAFVPRPPGAGRPAASSTDGVLELCDGADLVIHDAQYTDEEFVEQVRLGALDGGYAVRVAAEAGAKRLLLFHHDPARSDRDIERLVRRARRLPEAGRSGRRLGGQRGMTVDLGRP